ncbi:MAG: glutamate-1-semialdehyde 2,1-aminomutase, partial [Verrucomicrobia bacterium]|nr:glutamate-1-semialdehyde 2,1-aminomutase [Verrucomicrobiota bacterium]
ELTDYCGSWGPLLFGHARAEIVAAIREAAGSGTSFGINTPREVEFAELLGAMVPSMEMVRLVSSGTEATMTALRLARGFTERRLVIKFDGCYHGHADALLVAAGSGLLTGGISSSKGVSPAIAAEMLIPAYNDLDAVARIVAERGAEIAAIIVEPVAGNMGLVPPRADFLPGLRRLASACGAVLIFDEVITGFRLGPTTYGELCGVRPDLTCLGKIIGGGAPIGAVGGRADIMRHLAPLGGVYQAGTLSGNPLAVAAGLAMLKLIQRENPYARTAELAKALADGVNAAAATAGVVLHVAQLGSMFTPFFCEGPVTDLASVKRCDAQRYARFFQAMLQSGIYLPPSQFEVGFISAAHTDADIHAFVQAAAKAMRQ